MSHEVIDELLEARRREYGEWSEPYLVCFKAAQYMGYKYLRTEELANERTIDCSTLTSQAHWEGALIGIPFIAESQRRAQSGESIASVDEAIAGDVVIKYASVDAAPDKEFNHVALYLGRDGNGTPWVIESRGGRGVIVTPWDEFAPKGGIKRYTITTKGFTDGTAREALAYAALVPKYGRLGFRQYLMDSEGRIPHEGVDIYAPEGSSIMATASGDISTFDCPLDDAVGIEIVNENYKIRFVNIEQTALKAGGKVSRGELIGTLTAPSSRSRIRYSPSGEVRPHLHLECSILQAGTWRLANHLYLSKEGSLGLPLVLT